MERLDWSLQRWGGECQVHVNHTSMRRSTSWTTRSCKVFVITPDIFQKIRWENISKTLQPLTYASDREKIMFLVNLMWGLAAYWATVITENCALASAFSDSFLLELRYVFSHPCGVARQWQGSSPLFGAQLQLWTIPSSFTYMLWRVDRMTPGYWGHPD